MHNDTDIAALEAFSTQEAFADWHTLVGRQASFARQQAGERARYKPQPRHDDRAQPASPPPRLSFDNVSLEYRTERHRITAVHGVSFDVMAGDRFVLLGASGCGKSSLLKAAAGFLQPVEGSIRLDGRAVHKPGPDRIVVFQDFEQLLPWKSVRHNVMFPLLASRRMNRREADRRARQTLEKVGLTAFADVYPHMLSGGMKQRVAIARALAMQPQVLLMDEPFAALDALTRRRMQDELLALWREVGFTLLFVTHSIEEAQIIGNRVLLLSPHPGRVRAEIDCEDDSRDNLDSAAARERNRRIHNLLFEHAEPAHEDSARGDIT